MSEYRFKLNSTHTFRMILRMSWLLQRVSDDTPEWPLIVGAARFFLPQPHGDGRDGSEIGGGQNWGIWKYKINLYNNKRLYLPGFVGGMVVAVTADMGEVVAEERLNI